MSELKLTGTLIKVSDIETGVSKAGKEYKNRTFIIEVGGQYPKQIAFSTLNDKTSLIDGFSEGSEITVSFNIESREFNGKYFTGVTAWKIEGEKKQTGSNNQSSVNEYNLPPTELGRTEPDDSDLPF